MSHALAPDRSARRTLLIAAAIVLAALLLRLYRIGEHELWYDEAYSFAVAAMPNWVARALVDPNPPLYYLLLRGWVRVAGDSEAALRLLSAGFGTLAVAAVIWVGRLVLSPPVGLWAGAFAAVAPLHVYYSQEARTYTLLTLALLLTAGATWRALAREGWGAWALVAAGATVALYSHYFALLGLLPVAALLLLWPDRAQARRAWPKAGAAAAAAGLLFLPWVVWAFGSTSHSFVTIAWLADEWRHVGPWRPIPMSLEVLGLGGQARPISTFALKQFAGMEFPAALRALGLVTLGLLGLWTAVPWGDSSLDIPWLTRRKVWLGLQVAFPLVALWLVSLYKPLYKAGRYDMIAFPAYALLVGLALVKLHQVKRFHPLLTLMLASALTIPIGSKLSLYYQARSDRPAERTAAVLDRNVADGDVVVFTGAGPLTVLYYLRRQGYHWEDAQCRHVPTGRRFSCRFFPREYERPPFSIGERRAQFLRFLDRSVREAADDYLASLQAGAGSSLWVVLGTYTSVEGEGSLIVSMTDARLLRELASRGLSQAPGDESAGIFRFRRAVTAR